MEAFESGHSVPRGSVTRGEEMLQPDEVAARSSTDAGSSRSSRNTVTSISSEKRLMRS